MDLKRIVNISCSLFLRFVFVDFLAAFIGQSILLQQLWFTNSPPGQLLLSIVRNSILFALFYALLSYAVSYFLVADREIALHGNGVWISLHGPADEGPADWISADHIEPHLRDHCQPPVDFFARIRYYFKHEYETPANTEGQRGLLPIPWPLPPRRCRPLIVKAWPAAVFSFDKSDDQLWPYCSLIHVFALVFCDLCPNKDRLYIFRVSLLRLAWSHLLYSRPIRDGLMPSFAYGAVIAYQCNGHLFLHLDSTRIALTGIDRPISMFDLKNGQFNEFDTSLIDERRLILILPDTDGGNDESSLRLRVFDCRESERNGRPVTKFCVRRVEHTKNEKRGRVTATEEYDMGDYSPTRPIKTCDQVVFIFKKRRQHENQNEGDGNQEQNHEADPSRKLAIYNTLTGSLRFSDSMADFTLHNEEYRKCSDRYSRVDNEGFGHWGLQPLMVSKMEAMVARHSGALWHTTLQPPSLKYRALQEVFEEYDSEIEDFDAEEWREWSGCPLPQHFSK